MNDASLPACTLLALVSLTAVAAIPASREAAHVSFLAGGECAGCDAHVADGDGFMDGAQIVHQGHLVMYAFLTPEPGECGNEQCTPTKNCGFTAYCLAVGTSPFHDDLSPCNWSASSPFGDVIYTEQHLIAGCDKFPVIWSVRYFDQATNCGNGSLQGEVKFSGYCDRCSIQ